MIDTSQIHGKSKLIAHWSVDVEWDRVPACVCDGNGLCTYRAQDHMAEVKEIVR